MQLLQHHPNQLFVSSMCHSLHKGFWLWVDTKIGLYPDTWDFSDCPPKHQDHTEFIISQVETEVHLGQYSGPFGLELLLGMYLSPIHAVDKHGTTTF